MESNGKLTILTLPSKKDIAHGSLSRDKDSLNKPSPLGRTSLGSPRKPFPGLTILIETRTKTGLNKGAAELHLVGLVQKARNILSGVCTPSKRNFWRLAKLVGPKKRVQLVARQDKGVAFSLTLVLRVKKATRLKVRLESQSIVGSRRQSSRLPNALPRMSSQTRALCWPARKK